MAKIDTTKITGFEEMDDAAKLAALLDFEFDTDEDRLKAALTKANGDAAEWKRKYRETQSEQERAEAERAERDAERDALLRQLQDEKRVNVYKARLMEAGVDATTAETMANSLPEGVGDEYFTAYKSFMEKREQEIESSMLSKQPGLTVGAPPTTNSAALDEENKYRRWAGLPPKK